VSVPLNIKKWDSTSSTLFGLLSISKGSVGRLESYSHVQINSNIHGMSLRTQTEFIVLRN